MAELDKVIETLRQELAIEAPVLDGITPPAISVPSEKIIEVLTFLKNNEVLPFDLPVDATAIDTGDELQMVYILRSLDTGAQIVIKATLPKENPVIASATQVYNGFNWAERETYDMFGVTFEGHPYLKRILMPDEYEGYPLRKKYTVGGQLVDGREKG